MAMSSNSVVGIVLVVVLAALIGSIFIGDVLGQVEDEGSSQVVISSQEEMMKLILYDAMIAYGCDVGGNLDLNNNKFWGDWETMETYASNDPSNPKIYFGDLNSSMPSKFEGLPCYGTGSTLPGTGTKLSNTKLASKEWRDDQEGKYSKIEFKINDSDIGPGPSPVNLPDCFVHHTASSPGNVPTRPSIPNVEQYESRDETSEVTNSWFFMSNHDQNSVFNRGQGFGVDHSCERIINSGSKNPNSDNDHGPAMNVIVIDETVSTDTNTGGTTTVDGGSSWSPSSIEISSFEFSPGTTGYIQTNTGCTSVTAPHSISDSPGIPDKEIKGDGGTCDNKLHPFIVITSVP